MPDDTTNSAVSVSDSPDRIEATTVADVRARFERFLNLWTFDGMLYVDDRDSSPIRVGDARVLFAELERQAASLMESRSLMEGLQQRVTELEEFCNFTKGPLSTL